MENERNAEMREAYAKHYQSSLFWHVPVGEFLREPTITAAAALQFMHPRVHPMVLFWFLVVVLFRCSIWLWRYTSTQREEEEKPRTPNQKVPIAKKAPHTRQ